METITTRRPEITSRCTSWRRRIKTGDILMLSGPRTYRLASDLSVPPLDAREVFADLTAKLVRIGDGDDFGAIGGHVALDSERG
jgi:hypothetical protein